MTNITETTLMFSSENATSGDSHDFVTRFSPPIFLDAMDVCTVRLSNLSMAYSWNNIDARYGNNKVKYTADSGANFITITIPDGNYSYSQINDAIQKELVEHGYEKKSIQITFVSETLKVLVDLEAGFGVEFVDSFSQLLGFEPNVPVFVSSTGTLKPDITRSVDTVQLHTDLISSSIVDGVSGDVLYQFGTDDLQQSYPFTKRRFDIDDSYFPINKKRLESIRFRITDGLERPIHLNGESVRVNLILRSCH